MTTAGNLPYLFDTTYNKNANRIPVHYNMHIICPMEFIKLRPTKLSIFSLMKPKCTVKVQEQSFILSSFGSKDSFKENFSIYLEKCLHLVSNFFILPVLYYRTLVEAVKLLLLLYNSGSKSFECHVIFSVKWQKPRGFDVSLHGLDACQFQI